jgi:HD superfamily phosphodiesterase
MSEEKKRYLSASRSSLPLCSEFADSDIVKQVAKLLKRGNAERARISEAEERLDEIKAELSAICETYGIEKGFRHGLHGFEYHGWITRKALNKEKLATLVPADVIDKCYEDGKPFLSVKLIAYDID